MSNPKRFYICDGFGCKRARDAGGCFVDECKHTSDINHAKNLFIIGADDFEEVPGPDGTVAYFEKEGT